MAIVSIIVPVFNQAHHLDRCLESLRGQTLTDLEVIFINDGSTDGSLARLRRAQADDPRVRVIDQPNQGVSAARNAGLDIARGEFIGFVDSDDWVEAPMFESMVAACQRTGAPVCLCDFYFEKAGRPTPVRLNVPSPVLEPDGIFQHLILNMLAPDPARRYEKEVKGAVFRLLVRKSHLDSTGLSFLPHLHYMEDLIFTVGLLAATPRVCIDPVPWYHYRVNTGSSSRRYRPGLYDHLREVMDCLERALAAAGRLDDARLRLDCRLVTTGIRAIINEAHPDNPRSLSEKLAEIQRITTDPALRRAIPALDLAVWSDSRKWVYEAVEHGWVTALYLYFTVDSHFLDPTGIECQSDGASDRPAENGASADQTREGRVRL